MFASTGAALAVETEVYEGPPAIEPQIRPLGLVPYREAWQWMREFTEHRDAATDDQIWWLEHPPVYTLGLSGTCESLPPGKESREIETVHSDRGGQISYHGPGQLVVYPLIDLRRGGLYVRSYVKLLERSVIETLNGLGIAAERRSGAPGVYTNGSKIASLGIRVRRGCSYHGLALNVDLDLTPFHAISPCGDPGLTMTSLAALGVPISVAQLAALLLPRLCAALLACRREEFASP